MANNKDILLVVRADTKDADQKLGVLDEKLNNVKDSGQTAGSVLSDFGDTADDVSQTVEESSSSVGMLGNMLGVGLVAGIALAATALIGLTKDFFDANDSVENLTNRLEENWSATFKANQEWEKFAATLKSFDVAELIESMSAIERRAVEIGNKFLGPFGWITQITEQTGITNFMGELKNLRGEIDLLNESLFHTPKVLGWEDVPKKWQKAWKDSFKEVKEELKKITGGEGGDISSTASQLIYANGYRSRSGVGITSGGPASRNGGAVGAFSQGYAENLELVKDLTKSSANVLRSEFGSAWQDIFGEANSLFEKLLMNWAEMLANRGLNSLFSSTLDWLFPGAGTLASLAGGSNSAQTQAIVLQMDNQTMAKWYVSGKNQAGRLRLD